MKFKAHIKLTQTQAEDAVRHGLENTEYHDIEFTLKDLAENLIMVHEAGKVPRVLGEYLIPWLMEGNEPEVIEIDEGNADKLARCLML